MSTMNWHALHAAATTAKLSGDDEVYYGMPLVVTSDYKAKTTLITVPGQWNGSVDTTEIKMTTDIKSSPGNTVISFTFTGSEQATASGPLKSVSDPTVGCMVEVTYKG
jgi:hypothetical protein